ncbi:MAG: ABC transporter ATP-binding protein [Clostridia bacterium]|nr:ABC transporter ATP-binding protein [Clostridia bacterium]
MENVIEIRDLFKSFGTVRAVDGLSFRVKRGELFAFLGVNGAGTSTTISILSGQLKKDAGEVAVFGHDPAREKAAIARQIGVVFQTSALDQMLTVRDNLRSRAALYGITGEAFAKRLSELSELLSFTDLLDRTIGKLSGGQRRRIDVARALLHSPDLLILDEPTTGLDPQTRRQLWNVVNDLRKETGMTVFLTTHYMEEAADADYIVILDAGKIAAEGTPLDLKNRYAGDYLTVYGDAELPDFGYPMEKIRDAVRIILPNTGAATDLILSHPELFRDYEITKGKMDDVFLSVTGKDLAGGDDK